MAVAEFRIDQVGLPAGVNGRARSDGLATGAVVTLTATNAGAVDATFELLWVPIGDTTSVVSLAATGNPLVWTFTPTPGTYGSFRIQLTTDVGTPSESEVVRRIFRIRTPQGLAIPAFNEVADPSASLLNAGSAEVAASEDNEFIAGPAGSLGTFDYSGWFRGWHEVVDAVDALVGGGGGGGPFVPLDGSLPMTGDLEGTGVDITDTPTADGRASVTVDLTSTRALTSNLRLNGVFGGSASSNDAQPMLRVSADHSGPDFDPIVAVSVDYAGSSLNTVGIAVSKRVSPIQQWAGDFGNLDDILELPSLTNHTVALSSGGIGGVTLFAAVSDGVEVGETLAFGQVRITLATPASSSCKLAMQYSTGVGTWATYNEFIDYTGGCTESGTVRWDRDALVATGWVVGAGGYHRVQFLRTAGGVVTVPVVDQIGRDVGGMYRWDYQGDLSFRSAQFTRTPANPGVIPAQTIWISTADSRARQGADILAYQSEIAGEVNTASNVGSGADVFKQKTGADLEFRGIAGTNDITATVNADNIDVSGAALLPLSGSRAMTAALNMGGFPIKGQTYTTTSDTFASQQNDYNATLATTDTLRVNLTGSQSLTGILPPAAGENVRLTIENVDAVDTLTLPHESASSALSSRFACPNGVSLDIPPLSSVVVLYDPTAALRWRPITLPGGNETITLTGDVTGSGTGSFAATIANDAVTYAKIQNVSAASRLLGRGSAGGAGDTEEITLASNLSLSGTALGAVGLSGTNTGDQTITLTGDVTGSGTGSFAATITNDAVTFAKIQNVTADKLLGRGNGGGTGDTQEITLGTNLSMTGTTLNAASSGIGGTLGAVDNRVPRSDGTGGVTLQASSLTVEDTGSTLIASTVADTALVASISATGSNGALTQIYSGTRNPEGLVTALPGAIYYRVNGVTSRVYQLRSSGSANTPWRDISNPHIVLSAAKRTAGALISSSFYVGFDSETKTTISEYWTFDGAGTWLCNRAHTARIDARLSFYSTTSGTGQVQMEITKGVGGVFATVVQAQRSAAEQATDLYTTMTAEGFYTFAVNDQVRLYVVNYGGSPNTIANMTTMSIHYVGE